MSNRATIKDETTVRVVSRFRPMSKDEIERGDADLMPFKMLPPNAIQEDIGSYKGRKYAYDTVLQGLTS